MNRYETIKSYHLIQSMVSQLLMAVWILNKGDDLKWTNKQLLHF